MLPPQLEWLLRCCTRDTPDGRGEIQVLNCEREVREKQVLTKADSFDITFTSRRAIEPCPVPITPRQRDLRDKLELPWLQQYPAPPGAPEEGEELRRKRLLRMYQEFVLELHTGSYFTQLTSSRDYSDIHCQLMEDLQTLKLDQSNGRIIEFPLTSVSKVYRIVKNDDKLYAAATMASLQPASLEHIVVVEFMRRKLAFVFTELAASQRFLLCMELLIRQAQQKRAGRTLTPKFPPSSTGMSR